MRHLLLSTEIDTGETVRLELRDFHYLCRVLRLSEGDRFDLLDRSGRSFSARITTVGDDFLLALAEAQLPMSGGNADWCRPVRLYQAIPKGQKLDTIIRQTVQAGATTIVPMITERTVVRASEIAAAKLPRWQRIAREAVQQSGATDPAEVCAPIRLHEVVSAPDGVSLFLHPEAIAQGTLHGYLDRVPGQVELVVGPEGGFTAEEVAFLTDRGFLPLYLGPRVLRTETAAVFALGAVQILLQERGTWQLTD
jgi:16S rRNA (uracil1498-N3)-methyltransferase